MSKAMKICAAVAFGLVFLGLLFSVISLASSGWDFSKLGTVKMENNSHGITSDFDRIFINVSSADVEFLPSDDGAARVVCFEEEKMNHAVSVENSTLSIRVINEKSWYDYLGFSFGEDKIQIYLPSGVYSHLEIETDTGDVLIPSSFKFSSVKIDGDTSDVKISAEVSDSLEIETDTGDVSFESASAKSVFIETDTGDVKLEKFVASGSIQIETDTGDVSFESASAKSVFIEIDTGDVKLEKFVVSGRIQIETDTGDIRLKDGSAENAFIKTNTGDVFLEKFTAKEKIKIEAGTGDVEFVDCDAAEYDIPEKWREKYLGYKKHSSEKVKIK